MSLYGETKEAKKLQVDAGSLADLKAELFRKRGEAVKNRQKGNYRPEKVVDKEEKKTNIWSKKNTGLIARMQRDMEMKKEEERSHERARYMLEKKSRLYDSLKKGKGRSDVAENFLVNFGANNDSDNDEPRNYPATCEEEKWVEYTDALGRTRKCMKKDLPSLQEQDKEMVREDPEDQETGQGLRKEEPDMLNEEMRWDLTRQKWEQQEMENLTKESLHYTDVRFDEARVHGAGFYNFSREEEKRKQEQSTLRKLHEETDEMRKQKEKKAEKRKREMADRIRKIKNKKRLKQGLPPLSDDELEGDDKDENDSDSEDDQDISKSVMEGLKMFRRDNEEMERQKNSAMRAASSNRRDWDREKEVQDDDLGKSKEWKVMSQQQWVDKKRVERKAEFAPPSAYGEAKYLLKHKEKELADAISQRNKTSKVSKHGANDNNYPNQSNNFGPPQMQCPQPRSFSSQPIYATPPPPPGMLPTSPPPDFKSKLILDPMALLDQISEPSVFNKPDITADSVKSAEFFKESKPTYSKCIRMELHKRMKNQDFLPNPSEGLNSKILEVFNESDSEEDEDRKGGKGAQIAPPADMNYFNYTDAPKRKASGFVRHHDMAEAFNAGLEANKNKF